MACILFPLFMMHLSEITAVEAPSIIYSTAYPGIQAALDANPNRVIHVPAGDHVISAKIRIRGENSGLVGPGKIIQSNPEQPILEIERTQGTLIRDLTLTRPDGKTETNAEAILAIQCDGLVLENIKVINNRTRSSSVALRDCKNCRIAKCTIRNYSRITVDDRTANTELYGYAFQCIDGSGIVVRSSTGTLIEGNTIVEEHLRPTAENRKKYSLGKIIKKLPQKPAAVNAKLWEEEYTDNWHQGSALAVTSPESTDLTRILGNHIQNAAQGIDLHCDRAIVSQNIIDNAFIGMKAMHGSRNILITGNQFSRNDLWAIGLMPGAAAHAKNTDGGSIVANNIVSDFGHGDAHWIWGPERSPLKFDNGQQPDDPPLTDVIIQGNLVYNPDKPRYKYAVIIAGGPNAPKGLQFSNNHFPAGTQGVANRELKP
ncbi:MAG: hypothetical protein ACK47R_07015 [Planctomycetia bacterium]